MDRRGLWKREGNRVYLCGTLGAEYDRQQRARAAVSAAEAYKLQQAGLVEVELLMDELEAEARASVAADGDLLLPRRSPGYGQMPLSESRLILEKLDATKRLGVALTDSLLLVPSKSVTAICEIVPRPTVLDGGLGTMLQAAGLKAGVDPTDWNLDNPSAVTAVHRAYVEAGSDIILANTFGANPLKYHGNRSIAELVQAAVENARAAGAARIALDVGPTGRLLKPAGDLDFETAVEAFAETVRAGVKAGVDLVFIETIGDIRELKAAVLAARENASLPVFATVALGEDGKLLTGGSVECVAVLLESLGVDAYGFNCGLGPDKMLPYVERMARLSTKPMIVKPNAGLPKIVDGRTVFSVGPVDFAAQVRSLIAAGASIVGGCCGTTPDHIRELAK